MRSFGVDDVLGGPPSWPTLLKRGLRRHCPRCGASDIFETRFRLAERCPVCGLRFMREPGFRLGAWFLNYMFVAVLHLIAVMIWIVWRSNNPGGVVWPLVIASTSIVTIPILTYPWSLTLWSAVDLAMTPLELSEIVDAQDALGNPEPDGSDGPGDAADAGAPGDSGDSVGAPGNPGGSGGPGDSGGRGDDGTGADGRPRPDDESPS